MSAVLKKREGLSLGQASLNSDLVDVLDQIDSLLQSKDYEKALVLCDQVLSHSGIPVAQRDRFLYLRGVAFDLMGKPLDAYEVFLELLSRGRRLELVRSFSIVHDRVIDQAREIHRKDPAAPILEKLVDLLQRTHYAPGILVFAVALRQARDSVAAADREPDPVLAEKMRLEARQRAAAVIETYLDLSPNDPDYLSRSVLLAEVAGDLRLQRKLLARVRTLFEARPFIPGLVAILKRYERDPEAGLNREGN